MSNRIGITLEAVLGKIKTQIQEIKQYAEKTLNPASKIPLKIEERDLLQVKKDINEVKGEINDLNARARALKIDLKANNYPSDLKALQDVNTNLTAQKNKLADLRDEAKKLESQNLPGYFSNLSSKLSDTIKRIGLFTAAFTIINQTKNAIVGATKASIEFESALAGVNKTLDITAGELQGLDREFKRLSTEIPATYVEIAKIAELGGQLGVPKQEILEFTETMSKLKATTNLTSEEAIINFAKFNNILGITGDDIAKVGSVLVELGNNSATTESQILTFGKRIAASGKLAGLSAAEILAVGTAFSSAGIEAEAGGTAVQKVLLSIDSAVREGGTNLDLYAATAGKTSEEFAKYWEEDAGRAFADFVTGLGEAGDKSYEVLSRLGEDNVRTVRAFLATANSAQTLSKFIEMANEEFDNTNALQVEFQKRAETTESKLKIQRNQWALLGVLLGDEIAPVWLKVSDYALRSITAIGTGLSALGPLIAKTFSNLFINFGKFKDLAAAYGLKGGIAVGDFFTGKDTDTSGLDEYIKKVKETADKEKGINDDAYNNFATKLLEQRDLIVGDAKAKQIFIDEEVKKKKAQLEENIRLLEDELEKETDAEKKSGLKKQLESEKIREEELKAIEEDNKKRADYLDNYNEKQLKSSKKTAEGVIKITQKQLDYQLEIIATAQGEELEQAIDLADKLKAIIKKNTDYVEDKVQQEKEIYENAADYIEELLDTSKDKIDDLQKQLDKLQEIGKSQDEKIAERRLKIEQEIADTKEKIAEFDKNAVYWASQLTEEQLKQIGKGVLGTGADGSEITGDSVLKAQEELNKLNELEKELIENSEYLKQSVYEEKLAYDAKSETMKIVADMREKEKETLADLGLEYKTAEEAIKGIEQAIKDEQTAREISLAIQSNLTKQFTTLLGEETDKQIIFQNKFQEAVQASINKQRELNALLGASREASNDSASNTSSNVVNNISINGAGNPLDTARSVQKAVNSSTRGSTLSSNS